MTRNQLTLVSPDDGPLASNDTLLDWKSSSIAMPGEWSIRQRVLRGGVSDGVHVVDLSNGPLTVSVLPTRGMGIWKADVRGIPVGWCSPVKSPVHPRHVNLQARNGLGWLEGFNELVCRCGLSSIGPPGIDEGAGSPVESQLTLHGRIANTPAHTVEVGVDPSEQTLWIRGVCEEHCMFGPQLKLTSLLTIPAQGQSITIRDEVQNLSSREAEFALLYHVNVGPPFLDEGARFECPFTSMAPRDERAAEDIENFATCLKPTQHYAEQVYLFEPRSDGEGRSLAMLSNAKQDRGFSVEFNARQLPCLTLWKCTQAEADGYVTGLEPGTNFPNFKGFERDQKRIQRLSPGESFRAELTLSIHDSSESVASVSERIESIQSPHDPHVHSSPSSRFTPV